MAEIGYRLVRAREARGLTLEDAERDTRISRRYLEALEDEQFEVIPAPVYARGFLRSYAQYLGMDPQELLALFPRGDEPRPANGASPTVASMDNPIPAMSPSRPTWRQPPRFDSGRSARPEPRSRRRQPPPPMRTSSAPAGEYVIGAEDVTPPATPQPRSSAPALNTRTAPARRAPSRTVVTEPVIGQDPKAAAPTRRLERAPGEGQRNLIVIVAGIGLALVVGIAAVLIATLGGEDDPGGAGTQTTGTSSPGLGTTSGTVTTTAVSGAQPGIVPSVVGESEDDAVDLIEAAGLTARVLTEASAQPEGSVITQSPAAGTQRPSGSEVRIVVSLGQ